MKKVLYVTVIYTTAVNEYLRVLSSKQVNPLIIPPDALRGVLAQIKDDMKRNPRLQLPEDPNI